MPIKNMASPQRGEANARLPYSKYITILMSYNFYAK